jgi:hypothetical protein
MRCSLGLFAYGTTYLQAAPLPVGILPALQAPHQEALGKPKASQIETHAVQAKKNRLFLPWSQENREPVTLIHPPRAIACCGDCLRSLHRSSVSKESLSRLQLMACNNSRLHLVVNRQSA